MVSDFQMKLSLFTRESNHHKANLSQIYIVNFRWNNTISVDEYRVELALA